MSNLIGADKLIAELEKTVQNAKAAQGVLRQAGALVQRKAQSKAPVDTGNLRRSIALNVNGNRAIIRSNANYSGYLEYGTRYMKAQPYLRPAVEEVAPVFEKLLMEKFR